MAPPTFEEAKTTLLNAANDGNFQSTEHFVMHRDATTTFFAPTTARSVKLVNDFGLTLLNADGEAHGGRGLPVGEDWEPLASERRVGNDLAMLNEERLGILRERRITNDSLEWLHGLANAAIRKANSAHETAARQAQ